MHLPPICPFDQLHQQSKQSYVTDNVEVFSFFWSEDNVEVRCTNCTFHKFSRYSVWTLKAQTANTNRAQGFLLKDNRGMWFPSLISSLPKILFPLNHSFFTFLISYNSSHTLIGTWTKMQNIQASVMDISILIKLHPAVIPWIQFYCYY